LKVVDDYNGLKVSAFVTPGQVRFLLLHEKKDDDGIKNFFNEVHELYIKVLLNPFYNINTPIQARGFGERVRAVARKRLDV
jgi:trafficking protein particle complex subunit 2